MILKLRNNLYFLFISSLMLIFSIAFLLLVYGSLVSKRDAELAYFNRMTTILVLQLEHASDFKACMEPFEEKHDMSFQLLSDLGVPLYQSEALNNNLSTVESFLTRLRDTVGNFTLSFDYLKDNYYSRQSGTYTMKAADGKYYYCVNCFIVTDSGAVYTLTVMKECATSAALLWPVFGYYLIIWFCVLLSIIFLSRILITKAVKPVENAMQSQKAFIASVSHECKAPLAVILSSAEMIDATPNIPADIKKYVHAIDSEVSQMSRLIQDLLLLSSLDAGNRFFHLKEINVDTFLINLYTKFDYICRKYKLVLKLTIPEKCCPPLYSDENRLNQILSIFLDNAIAYSNPDSEIFLISSIEKNHLIISIIDHGIGISDSDKPFIFDRFYQCDKSHTKKEHFGLGLSIANELVYKLGGKIQLFDTAGGGCTFKIFIPFNRQRYIRSSCCSI